MSVIAPCVARRSPDCSVRQSPVRLGWQHPRQKMELSSQTSSRKKKQRGVPSGLLLRGVALPTMERSRERVPLAQGKMAVVY